MQKSAKPSTTKPRKNKNQQLKPPVVKTKVARTEISANWKTFLSQQAEGSPRDKATTKPERYTGPFRRERKLEGISQAILPVDQTNNIILPSANNAQKQSSERDIEPVIKPKITKYVAIDCEMVGIGEKGEENMLARVSLVNKFGECIYDKFVIPREEVVDYRTNVSGIRAQDLQKGISFDTVVKDVAEILRGKILVGHAVHHDLAVLLISHPKRRIRDTSRYKPFRKLSGGKTPGLRKLAKELLDVDIQKGEHSSIEDARAAMQLYITHSKQWENQIRNKSVQVIN